MGRWGSEWGANPLLSFVLRVMVLEPRCDSHGSFRALWYHQDLSLDKYYVRILLFHSGTHEHTHFILAVTHGAGGAMLACISQHRGTSPGASMTLLESICWPMSSKWP